MTNYEFLQYYLRPKKINTDGSKVCSPQLEAVEEINNSAKQKSLLKSTSFSMSTQPNQTCKGDKVEFDKKMTTVGMKFSGRRKML